MERDEEALREFAERYTAAWCSQDAARVASFFAPDGSLQVNDAPAAVGREAITLVARSFMLTFPDLRVMMDDLVRRGSAVEYHWTLTGTYRARHKVRVSGYEEWRMGADGLIASSLGHFDADEYARQVGG